MRKYTSTPRQQARPPSGRYDYGHYKPRDKAKRKLDHYSIEAHDKKGNQVARATATGSVALVRAKRDIKAGKGPGTRLDVVNRSRHRRIQE